MNDKLKEIRDKYITYSNPIDGEVFKANQVKRIQSETYQLGRQEVIDEILENENAWNLAETLAKLLEATEILMDEKDYDGHGWELIAQAQTRGKEFLSKLYNLKK